MLRSTPTRSAQSSRRSASLRARIALGILGVSLSTTAPARAIAADPERSLAEIGGGVDVGGRWFHYNDALTGNARPYDVFGAPLLEVAGELYPLARRQGPLGDLGLTASYGRALGLDSSTDRGASIPTTWDHAALGLRFRFHPASDAGPLVGLSAGYASQRFAFEAPSYLRGTLADTRYRSVRAGADVRVPLDPFALVFAADCLGALDAGPVHDRFRDASVGGVGLRAGAALAIARRMELRVAADYTRYFYAFAPIPGDAYVAGGAVEQQLRAGLSAHFTY